jgi:hypothetical protein
MNTYSVYKAFEWHGNMATPCIHWFLWLWSLHEFVGMMISHSHSQQIYCDQYIRDWVSGCSDFFSPLLVWMVLFLQWDVWLNGEFASWILHKKENLENVHLEVHLWILNKWVSAKLCALKLVKKVVDHWFSLWQKETIQEICANWRKTSRYLGGMVRSLCLAHTTDFFAMIFGHGHKTNLNFTCTI